MASLNWQRAKRLFEEALAKAPEERRGFVEAECADDSALASEVLAMLAAGEDDDNPLRTRSYDALTDDAETAERVMAELDTALEGRYHIEGVLGKGGMGRVYLAEQLEPVRREVALKVLDPGLDTAEVRERFERERHALAAMDHPGIAKIYDAGVTRDGQSWFAMELVSGKPLTEHSDDRRLSLSQRLRLFARVCEAVQHAHQKGVIHRDLKPSNVLVKDADGQSLPQIIDFGIAKSEHLESISGPRLTQVDQVIGTPAYMSPEQIEGLRDIDTRADVYSLGVLLYELLAGALPYDPAAYRGWAALAAAQARAPRPPGQRFSELSDTQETVASRRATSPRVLSRALRGDLDWIVGRALASDREERYATVAAFASDVERYLAGRPVAAHPGSVAYRAKRFVLRNKLSAGLTAAMGLAIIAGLIGTSIGMAEARREATRSRALSHLSRADLAWLSGDPVSSLGSAFQAAAEVFSPDAERSLRRALGASHRIASWEGRLLAVHPAGGRAVVQSSSGVVAYDSDDFTRPSLVLDAPEGASINYVEYGERVLSAHVTSGDRTPMILQWAGPELTPLRSVRRDMAWLGFPPIEHLFSADGGLALVLDGDTSIVLQDLGSAGEIRRFSLRPGLPGNDASLLTGDGVSVLEYRDTVHVTLGEERYSMPVPAGARPVAVWPEQDVLVVSAGTGIHRMSLSQRSIVESRTAGSGSIGNQPYDVLLDVTGDQRHALIQDPAGVVEVLDLERWEPEAVVSIGAVVESGVISPDGRYVAVAGIDGVTHAFELTTEGVPLAAGGAIGGRPVGFLEEGRLLTQMPEAGTVEVWDLAVSGEIPVPRPRSLRAEAPYVDPAGHVVINGSRGLERWRPGLPGFDLLREGWRGSLEEGATAFRIDAQEDRLQVWDARTGATVAEIDPQVRYDLGVRWAPNAGVVLLPSTPDCDQADSIGVFDVTTGRRMSSLSPGHRVEAVSPDGRYAVTVRPFGQRESDALGRSWAAEPPPARLVVWNLERGDSIGAFEVPPSWSGGGCVLFSGAAVAASDEVVAVADGDSIRLSSLSGSGSKAVAWDRVVIQMRYDASSARFVLFDGTGLAWLSADGRASGRFEDYPPGLRRWQGDPVLAPRGPVIAIESDGEIAVWNTLTGELIAVIPLAADPSITTAGWSTAWSLSPNGSRVLVRDAPYLRLHTTDRSELLTLAAERLGRRARR